MKIVDLMFKHCKLMDGKGKYKIEKGMCSFAAWICSKVRQITLKSFTFS